MSPAVCHHHNFFCSSHHLFFTIICPYIHHCPSTPHLYHWSDHIATPYCNTITLFPHWSCFCLPATSIIYHASLDLPVFLSFHLVLSHTLSLSILTDSKGIFIHWDHMTISPIGSPPPPMSSYRLAPFPAKSRPAVWARSAMCHSPHYWTLHHPLPLLLDAGLDIFLLALLLISMHPPCCPQVSSTLLKQARGDFFFTSKRLAMETESNSSGRAKCFRQDKYDVAKLWVWNSLLEQCVVAFGLPNDINPTNLFPGEPIWSPNAGLKTKKDLVSDRPLFVWLLCVLKRHVSLVFVYSI